MPAMRSRGTSQMKSRPIVLRDHEVQAILNGSKVQLRRPFKGVAYWIDTFGYTAFTPNGSISGRGIYPDYGPAEKFYKSPYGVKGDKLWVREVYTQYPIEITPEPCDFWYRADSNRHPPVDLFDDIYAWRPAIQMLKEASRITLEITNIRVERLQSINSDGALAEGIVMNSCSKISFSPVYGFRALWDELNKSKWIDNPWVWVVEFKVLKTHN